MNENAFNEDMDQVKRIKDAIRHHMDKTQWDGRTHWGPWFLDEKNKALAFMYADSGVLKRHHYDIPLDRVVTVYGRDNDSIEDWSFHLYGKKAWIRFDDVLQVVEALCSLYKADRCGEQVKA